MSSKKSISGLISLFLLCIVGLALTPIVQENVAGITGDVMDNSSGTPVYYYDNLTGSSRTLMKMFPLFWVILMIAIPVAGVSVYLKS